MARRKRSRGLRGLGAVGCHHSSTHSAKVSISRVRLNRGGYDSSGRYFGAGDPVFHVDDGIESGYMRGRDRNAVKTRIREACPRAMFKR